MKLQGYKNSVYFGEETESLLLDSADSPKLSWKKGQNIREIAGLYKNLFRVRAGQEMESLLLNSFIELEKRGEKS